MHHTSRTSAPRTPRRASTSHEIHTISFPENIYQATTRRAYASSFRTARSTTTARIIRSLRASRHCMKPPRCREQHSQPLRATRLQPNANAIKQFPQFAVDSKRNPSVFYHKAVPARSLLRPRRRAVPVLSLYANIELRIGNLTSVSAMLMQHLKLLASFRDFAQPTKSFLTRFPILRYSRISDYFDF